MKVTLNNANGYTSIQIDGQPHTPAAMRSFRPQPESNRNFADQGYEFFQVFPSGVYCGFGIPYSAYGEVWVGMGEYNWDNLKNQVDMFKASMNPDGYVSVIVHADTRDWFIKNHPECLDSFNYLINAACCEEWKAAVAEYTCALMDKMEEIGSPVPDEEDYRIARLFSETALAGFPNVNPEDPIAWKLEPYTDEETPDFSSTDVGDISWVCPTAQILTATFARGTPPHTWQMVSQGKLPQAHKMTRYAAKVMAASAVEMMSSPELLQKAQEEFRTRVGDGYDAPIPKDVFPKAMGSFKK